MSWRHFHVSFHQTFPRQRIKEKPYRTFLIEKCSYFSEKLIKQHIFKSKCNCRMKIAGKRIHNGSSVQIENSVIQVTARYHSASLMMPNSYPHDGIFNQHLTTIKGFIFLPIEFPKFVVRCAAQILKIGWIKKLCQKNKKKKKTILNRDFALAREIIHDYKLSVLATFLTWIKSINRWKVYCDIWCWFRAIRIKY